MKVWLNRQRRKSGIYYAWCWRENGRMRQSYIGKEPPVGDPPTVEELIAKSKKPKVGAGGSGVASKSFCAEVKRSDVDPKVGRVEVRPSKVAGVSSEALPPTLGELIASGADMQRICNKASRNTTSERRIG